MRATPSRHRAATHAAVLAAAVLSSPAAHAQVEESRRRDATVLVVERVGPAVANIATERVVEARVLAPWAAGGALLDDWLGRSRVDRRVVTSLGSGVVVDPAGYVLTNAHVVARASRIVVALPGREPQEAQLLSLAPDEDLALLKVDAGEPLPAVRLGRAGDVMVGETCLALGNPFGLENTVTRGVVSARDRRIEHQGREVPGSFLQTDAAINPGSSGGPLVNLDAELIGINTAILLAPDGARGTSGEGIGFALPVDRVRRGLTALSSPLLLRDLDLGVELEDTPDDAGARVVAVASGGPGEAAGLAPGDVVVAAGPASVATAFSVHRAFLEAAPGPVRLAVRAPDGTRRGAVLEPAAPPHRAELERRLGVTGRDLTPALAWRLGLRVRGGVLVEGVEAGGPAAGLGLAPGDVLAALTRRAANGAAETTRVASLRDAVLFLSRAPSGEPVTLTVVRAGREYRGELRLR